MVERRQKLWDTLVGLKSNFSKPWCLGGDFNEIRSVGERIGCSRRDRGMKEFNSFIESCELSDIPLLGRRFTWSSAQERDKWSKLDRFLVNPEWLEVFKLKVWGLRGIGALDHLDSSMPGCYTLNSQPFWRKCGRS